MLNAVATSAATLVTNFVAADLEPPANDLNPIAPELKEMVWGFGSFLVLLVVLRYFIWPKLRRSIDERGQRIADDLAAAEAQTAAARADVAEYEAQRAAIRAEANVAVEEARAVLERERSEQLAAANARIAERRAAAVAEVEAAREAARADVESAVAAVVASAGQLATGRTPDDAVVRRIVTETMTTGAPR